MIIYKAQLRLLDKGILTTNDSEATRKDLNNKISISAVKIEKTKSEIKDSEVKVEKLKNENSKIINTTLL